MNSLTFDFRGTRLAALPSGALWHAAAGVLCVSDLHLGKSERIARRGGTMLPPYETADTLARLEADLGETGAGTVVCLGDSFDDLAAAAALDKDVRRWIGRLQRGRAWIWVEGNHDPGPSGAGGTSLTEVTLGGLHFRHIAAPDGVGEVSGHYHPKARFCARGKAFSRPCILYDDRRVILPAYGTYTGGLDWTAPALQALIGPAGCAVLVGAQLTALPVPREARRAPQPPRAPRPRVRT